MVSTHYKGNLDIRIRSFWKWFETIADDLGRNLDNQVLLAELDYKISSLGDVSWEVGPGHERANALVITPDGARQQLTTTREIVGLAPQIPDWEFYWAKPPRKVGWEFSIDSEQGGSIRVNARNWRYVLFRYPDQTFDIVLEQSSLKNASEHDRYTAAVVLLDGMLGELKRLELIGAIEAVAEFSDEQNGKANPIAVLSTHLASLVVESRPE